VTAPPPPSPWREYSLGKLLGFSNGINAGKSAYGSGVLFVNVLEVITKNSLTKSDLAGKVAVDPTAARAYAVRRGDILFNRTSETQEEVGLAAVFEGIEPVVFGGFVIRGRPLTKSLTREYSRYALRGRPVRLQLIARGQGGIRANIGQRDLRTVTVHLPPPGEQLAIAAALDDVEDTIAALKKLIAKKEAIRTGTTQQLLTGRTRLPGFDSEWAPLRIAAKSELKARIGWQGLTTAEYRSIGTHRLVGGTEFAGGSIDWQAAPFVDEWRYDQDAGIQLREGDVLLTKDGSIGKTAYVDELPGPATLNSGVFVMRPLGGAYDPRFLYFMLRSRAFEDFLTRLSAGSTISHLYQRDLVKLVLDFPPTLEEQDTIAAVLWDMDSEVAALRARLAKACSVRAGMMQELLTGRTRLPMTEAAT
jgi:type I restriction enzyme, S subunit